jgi:DNA-binding NarL/FixJ family response regulator
MGGGLFLVTASLRILVVDDSVRWRHFLVDFLHINPALQVVCEASDGLEAIEKSRDLQPDLILLDIGLPKLNGLEAARQIQEVAPNSKVLFLSENRSPDIVSEALRLGGCGYVVKSDAGRDLLPALEAVLANKLRRTQPSG